MLEFATKCPQPASLWKTLLNATISPAQGYSADQIRFLLFMDLSLSTDFTIAKNRANSVLKDISQLSKVYTALYLQLGYTYNLNFSTTDFQKLKPIEDMTDVVILDNLDIPSIFIRQLLYGRDVTTSAQLTMDLFHIGVSHTYIDHLVVDIPEAPDHITMYQLNTSEPFQYFDKFTIDSSLPKLSITCKEDIDIHMRGTLASIIYSSETGMIPTDTTIVIPEFILQVPSKKPEYSPKDEPSPSAELSWDDVTVGTKLRFIGTGSSRTVGAVYRVAIIDEWVHVTSNSALIGKFKIDALKENFSIEEI